MATLSPTPLSRTRDLTQTAPGLSRYLYPVAIAALIAGGLLLRVHQLGRSLSIAEAWVANSATANSLHDVFYYANWLQTTPPLFLCLIRLTVKLFGFSDLSLRAVPVACGVLALILFARLAQKMLTAPFAVLATALVALSPIAIVYSKEVKQYSSDVMATCLALLMLWGYLDNPDRRRYLWLLTSFSLMLLWSYDTAACLPLALGVIFFCRDSVDGQVPARLRLIRCIAFAGVTGAITLLTDLIFIKPNRSPLLTNFWESGFPPHGVSNAVRFYLENVAAMGVSFYVPAQSQLKDALRVMVLALPLIIQLALLMLIGLVVTGLVKVLRRSRNYRWAAVFCVVPLLTLLVLNGAHLYPISSRRLTLFLLPCVALATAASLEGLWEISVGGLLNQRARVAISAAVTLVCVVGVPALAFTHIEWDVDRSEDGGHEAAFRYLKAQVHADRDVLYVHALAEEPALLYFRMLRWQDAPVRYGSTGWPCCKRFVEERPRDPMQLREYVARGFDSAVGPIREGDLWLLFVTAPALRADLREEPAIIDDRLTGAGCTKELERRFDSDLVQEFQCSGPTRVTDFSDAGQSGFQVRLGRSVKGS